ncbi:MAG: GTP-binding protein [Marinobacter sp.]|nr:GTP-binding protein [Marinobacter sp.]
MTQPIPTHLILGFLGAGKTTAILDLLQRKPTDETWAVLVNEFGEVGIDGALMQQQGVVVREVPGGCMCCVSGLPMQMGLNMLIQRAKPDRLLIEPTGLGHPAQIIETLTGQFYREVLSLGTIVTLVDPRKLSDSRVQTSDQFRDQVAVADVLVANKTDLCSAEEIDAFHAWAERLEPAKRLVTLTRDGQLDMAWLAGRHGDRQVDVPASHQHNHALTPPTRPQPSLDDEPWQCRVNRGQGHYSLGWRVAPATLFNPQALLAFIMDERFLRVKGVVHTDDGWLAINVADGCFSANSADARDDSRLEIIANQPLPIEALDQQLRDLALTS